jgi:hypothetical protein
MSTEEEEALEAHAKLQVRAFPVAATVGFDAPSGTVSIVLRSSNLSRANVFTASRNFASNQQIVNEFVARFIKQAGPWPTAD